MYVQSAKSLERCDDQLIMLQPCQDFPGVIQAKQCLTHSDCINVDEIINFIGYGPLQVKIYQ